MTAAAPAKVRKRPEPKSYVECPRCERMVTLVAYKRSHGWLSPECICRVWRARLREMQWEFVGPHGPVLARAGVSREYPVGAVYVWQRNPLAFEDPEDDDRWSTPSGQPMWGKVRCVHFVPCAPEWARQLARLLIRRHDVAEKVGLFKIRRRYTSRLTKTAEAHRAVLRRASKSFAPGPGDFERALIAEDKVMPIDVRARIIKTCAQSAFLREHLLDDFEGSMILVKAAIDAGAGELDE